MFEFVLDYNYVLVKRGNYEVVKLVFTAIGLK